MTTTTESFIENHGNKLTTWSYRITVERTPASISDLCKKSRWFQTVGSEVVSVTRVKITTQDITFPSTFPSSEEGFEVTFKCGVRGYIAPRSPAAHEDIDAIVDGTTGYLHGLSVFRKRGHIVGSPVSWFRAQPSSKRGRRLNSNTARRCCAAELYARAQGKTWGERATSV